MLLDQIENLSDPNSISILISDVRRKTPTYAMLCIGDQNPVNNYIPSSENASISARVMANHTEDND